MGHSACCHHRLATLFLTSLISSIIDARAPSQAFDSVDSDRRYASVVTVGPNGTNGTRPAFVVAAPLSHSDGFYRIEAPGGQPCDLVLVAGGLLSVERARLEIRGSVYFRPGGVMRAIDTDISVLCSYARQFNYYWEGGDLDTRRVTIGGKDDTSTITNFFLENGLWNARDTVVHQSGGILVGEQLAPISRQGGELIADGLFPGRTGDFVHMNGKGHAILKNSRFGISLRLYDPGPGNPTIPLDNVVDVPATEVFGDASFHSGVTRDIPGCNYRLELVRTQVSGWAFQIFDLSPTSNPRTYQLQGDSRSLIGLHATDLSGAPVLTGPWGAYYGADLPALPSIGDPAFHPFPPGCGVTIGPATFVGPSTGWSRVGTWDLYLDGPATNFTVRGSARIGEIVARDGNLVIEGIEGFDAGVMASTVTAAGSSRITLRDVRLGTNSSQSGEVAATGQGVCIIDGARLRKVRLRTGVETLPGAYFNIDRGSITLRHYFPSNDPAEVLTTLASRPNSVQVIDEVPSSSADLQNLDFELGGLGNGSPKYWSTSYVTGVASSTTRPYAAAGQLNSFEGTTSGTVSRLEKRLTLPRGTVIEFYGFLQPLVLLPGATIEASILGSAGGASLTAVSGPIGAWDWFQVAPYKVAPGDSYVSIGVTCRSPGATPVRFRIDDVKVQIAGFWEDDNLIGLEMEEPRIRSAPSIPDGNIPPDFWDVIGGVSAIETVDLRPGTTGSQSLALSVAETKIALRKRLRFLPAGRTLTLTGWVKVIPGPGRPLSPRVGTDYIWAYVGEGNQYFAATGNNVQQRLGTGLGWLPISLIYSIPTPPNQQAFTSVVIAGALSTDTVLIDDCTVVVQ